MNVATTSATTCGLHMSVQLLIYNTTNISLADTQTVPGCPAGLSMNHCNFQSAQPRTMQITRTKYFAKVTKCSARNPLLRNLRCTLMAHGLWVANVSCEGMSGAARMHTSQIGPPGVSKPLLRHAAHSKHSFLKQGCITPRWAPHNK